MIKDEILKTIESVNYPLTPTQVGMMLGKSYNSASSYTSKHLKNLVTEGKIKSFKGSANRVYYSKVN